MDDGRVTSVTHMDGIFAASVTDGDAATGCTVVVCPRGATAGVDVRGGAPATRETDLLRPEESVGVLHAVVLSGGSAYGLAAACGVAEELERRSIGLDVGVGVVPIVSSACLFDLGCGRADVRPDASFGAEATRRALCGAEEALETGNVGAGAGCTVGKLAGMGRAMKSGLGEGVSQRGALVCGAIAAVNAVGNVIDPRSGRTIAGALSEGHDAILDVDAAMDAATGREPLLHTNTTISCVTTNARLTKAQATKVAQMAADAYAHTINPTHTPLDGDTVFVMATGEVEASVETVGYLATGALEQAIVSAVRDAPSAHGYPSAREFA